MEKKTDIVENTPCSIFQKKHDHLQVELTCLCGWLCFRRLSEPFLVNKSEEPLYDTAQLLGVPLHDFPLSVDEPTGGYQLWKQPDTPCYLTKYILSYYAQWVSTHLHKSLERNKKLPQKFPKIFGLFHPQKVKKKHLFFILPNNKKRRTPPPSRCEPIRQYPKSRRWWHRNAGRPWKRVHRPDKYCTSDITSQQKTKN